MKKILLVLSSLLVAGVSHAVNPIYGTVRITTATVTIPALQTGTINISSGTILNLKTSTMTLTSMAVSTMTVSSLTVTGAFSAANNRLTLVSTPTATTDAATKGYIDTIANGSTNYIQNGSTVQTATFNVSSGTVAALRSGSLVSSGTVNLGATTNSVTISTNIVFSPTTAGIKGTTTNDTACVGCVGEVISAGVSFVTPIPLATAAATSISTITLTAGQWSVVAMACIKPTNAGTAITEELFAISTTNNAVPGNGALMNPQSGQVQWDNVIASYTPGANNQITIGTIASVFNLASTTPVYFVELVNFTNTLSGCGSITATRIR